MLAPVASMRPCSIPKSSKPTLGELEKMLRAVLGARMKPDDGQEVEDAEEEVTAPWMLIDKLKPREATEAIAFAIEAEELAAAWAVEKVASSLAMQARVKFLTDTMGPPPLLMPSTSDTCREVKEDTETAADQPCADNIRTGTACRAGGEIPLQEVNMYARQGKPQQVHMQVN